MTQKDNGTTVWGLFELVLHGPKSGNPFLEVEFGATFTQGAEAISVPGFYDGDGVYRVRFMPADKGRWAYATTSNATDLNGVTGHVDVAPARIGAHGPVRADGMHFRHADGRRYVNVGTTAYAWTHQTELLQEETLNTLAKAPFTKIRMCVFPKHYRYNETEPALYPFALLKEGQSTWPASQEESGWDWDFDRPNPAFFVHLERRITQLGQIGIEADLILMHPYDRWGFDHMSAQQDDRYLKYLVSRLAALPNVWWSLANEYDLMNNKSLADWDRFVNVVSGNDPYGHLLSNHNCFEFYNFNHPLISHCSIQHEMPHLSVKWREKYGKPISIDECCYEGDISEAWGNISGQEMTHRFWTATVNGAYASHGETYYNDSETVWWGKGGKLIGDSVPRIAFLRHILEKGPDQGLDPMEWTFPYRMTIAGDRENVSMHRVTLPPPEQMDWEPKMTPMFEIAGQPDQYYLVYFGPRQPHEFKVAVPPGQSYCATLVDTWGMHQTKIASDVVRGDVLQFAPKAYQALIFERN